MKFTAVTSCPTGIAHSQMAAENLEETARQMGHEMRVEVQGAMGTEDELTAEEIAEADAVIIAADTGVNRDRFEDRPLVKGTVKDAVNDAEGLIERAVEAAGGDADGADAKTSGDADESEAGGSAGTTDDGATTSAGSSGGDRRRGGDRSKSLVARIKRLFS